MADFNALEALINAYIKQNGVQAITGQILNGVLRGMVSALGKGWTVAGEAEPNTDPGTMTGPVAYVAHTAGTYTNFGGLVVDDGEVAFLKYNEQVWTKEVLASLAATASVDGNVGTPYVETQFVNGVLTFAFHNVKGDPGINGTDGDAAGFGTVTATVDNTVGTPAVSVTESGPNTAKNFSFAFTGLKGETGVTSVVVTVDNTSGTPQCTASLNAGVLTLAFTGLKGQQGDTGSSVDYPFTLVNNCTTNDATQGLAAAQGVYLDGKITQLEHKVMENVNLLLASLGEYAFPNGRPSLPWNGNEYNITNSLTNVTSSNPSLVVYEHRAYYAELSPTSESYVLDSVVVTMGGTDITSTAYSNGVVSIADVTGDIAITASAITYVQDGLVFRLNGKNRGETAGHWIDNIGSLDFALTNCTEEDDGVVFDGSTSKGVSSGVLNTLFSAGTIEVVYDSSNSGYPTTYPQIILTNSVQLGIAFGLSKNGSVNSYVYAQATSASALTESTKGWNNNSIQTKAFISVSTARCYVNGVAAVVGGSTQKDAFGMDSSTGLAIGYRHRTGGDSFYKGKIFEIRVYSRQLTQAEILNNYAVDSNRYTI